jgi:Tol biopolymer transport system component
MNRQYLRLLLVFVSAVLHSTAYAEKIWVKQQITNNTVDDRDPVLTDMHVAWLSRLNADNDEVYVFDGNTTTRLTNNVLNDQNIFLWDTSSPAPRQITNSAVPEYRPRVSGTWMVWERSVNDVLLYNIATGATPVQIIAPGGSGNELEPCIFGNWVSFTSNEGDSEIYYHDIAAGETRKLTENDTHDNNSNINDKYIAWLQGDAIDHDVLLYDRASGTTSQMTDFGDEYALRLDGNNLVYASFIRFGLDKLICHDAAAGTTQVIATNLSGSFALHGDYVVYSGWDGHDQEIYLYEISSGATTQLTDNELVDDKPQVRGERIAWQVYDGLPEEGDFEIMLATLREVEASPGIPFPVRTKEKKTIILNF